MTAAEAPPLPAPIPAATLIALRDRAAGPPELLMIERAAGLAFAAGAWVFPGGRVEPGDAALAGADDGEGAAEATAKVAAIRETIEEAGLALGLDPAPDAATLAAIRAGLAAGRPFAALLAAAGCRLDLDALVPFARWIPPGGLTRRFDTRFFLARAAGTAEAAADGSESVALRWTSAADALAAAAAGTLSVIFPTHCNLVRLAPLVSFAAAAAAARALPVRALVTYREERDGVLHVCVPEGFGYPPIAMPLQEMKRG